MINFSYRARFLLVEQGAIPAIPHREPSFRRGPDEETGCLVLGKKGLEPKGNMIATDR